MAGLGPADVDVIQIQDTESGAEVMHMAENGFCGHGEQEQLIRAGATQTTGSLPINTDGGCLACGEPIGASGLRQVYENVQQLRGRAGKRGVEGARIGYSQVYGAPGLSAVAILEA
jgi:acetyl-CoA acetyltransferase